MQQGPVYQRPGGGPRATKRDPACPARRPEEYTHSRGAAVYAAGPLPSPIRCRGGAMTETEIESLKEKITTLRLEHHDLDAAICRMEESKIF